MKMTIRGIRLAFPAIFEKQAIGDGEPAYGAKGIIPPDHPQVSEIEAAMLAAAKAKWNEKGEQILGLLKEEKKVAFVRGPYRNKNGDVYDGFDGMFHVSTRSADTQPTAFDSANNPTTKDAGLLYGGAFVDMAVEFWAQDNKWGRRLNCTLRGVRFVKHGDRFSGSPPAGADEFGAPLEQASGADFV